MRWSLLTCVLCLAACKTTETPPSTPAPPPAPPPAAARPVPPGIDESTIDAKVDPCDDFYRYACGGWLAREEIRPDRAWSMRGFLSVSDRNELILKKILEDAAAGQPLENAPYAKQLGDYYATCMDEAQLETAEPALRAELKKLDAVKDAKSLATALGQLHAVRMFALFYFGSTQDAKDATQVIGEVGQGWLTLPDRDFYLSDDPKRAALKAALQQYAARMFELLGQKPEVAKASAETVLSVETELAKASLSRVEQREPSKVYHRLERTGLAAQAPGFAWDAYFAAVGAPALQKLNVTHPPFFAQVSTLAKTLPAATWRTYLTWNLVHRASAALPKKFRDETFKFVSATTGSEKEPPRWETCTQFATNALSEALAQPFVARTFGPDGKAKALELVKDIEASFERNLGSLSWMDAETKARALEKERKITNKVGYPEKWRSYEALKTDRSSFFANLMRARAFEQRRLLDKIGKPVDREEWLFSPTITDAYYAPEKNEIVFPAGILQPPFFDKNAAAPVNFGAMGAVVGHEITHGFDDEGRQYDPEGNLRDWWTEASAKAYLERTACVEKQYSEEIAVEDLHINGKLTLGENLSDMGGVKLAFAAMKQAIASASSNEIVAPYRYTPEQQFFLGFAQGWCGKLRPQMARILVNTDPHSPFWARVNVPLRNLPAFQQAFSCKEGAKMVRPAANRCEVW